MRSSSTYAAPLLIELTPSWFERWMLAIAMGIGFSALMLAALSPVWIAALSLLAVLYFAGVWRRIVQRPPHLLFFADGLVECSAANTSVPRPAELLQASWFGPIPHLQFRILGDRHAHALALFPDRLDPHSRQRLRVWLATHRPHPKDAAADDVGRSV